MSEADYTSKVVDACQICGNGDLKSILSVGFLPPVNALRNIGERLSEEPSYPAELFFCDECKLMQLGLVVNPKILFPVQYPYTSSTTKVLRENFKELYSESSRLIDIARDDLVVDIGSNDGNLLSNFKDYHQVLGITPEEIGKLAVARGIPTVFDYFHKGTVEYVKSNHGKAKIVTATNVFAHIDDVNHVTDLITDLLDDKGVFISESHYLYKLVQTLQYDTIYHEHLRYYSLESLINLFERHDLEVFHAKDIPSHGGSIRVYAARKGDYQVNDSVKLVLEREKAFLTPEKFEDFRKDVVLSKINLYNLIKGVKTHGMRIYGIGAPSRASTLINYVGLDEGIIDSVMEVPGSHKIGKYVPGTKIPIYEEAKLYQDQPEYAILFSWHIADELAPKLREKGYKGNFIVPLPEPRII